MSCISPEFCPEYRFNTGCPKNNVTPCQRQFHENNKHERRNFLTTYVSHLLPDAGKHTVRDIRHQHVQLLWTDLGPDRSNVPGQRAFRLSWRRFAHLGSYRTIAQRFCIGDRSGLFTGHLSFSQSAGKLDLYQSFVVLAR